MWEVFDTYFADDFQVYVASKRAGEQTMESLTHFIETKLKLKVNQEKSAVDLPGRERFLALASITEKMR